MGDGAATDDPRRAFVRRRLGRGSRGLGGSDHFEHFLAPVFSTYAPPYVALRTQRREAASWTAEHEEHATELTLHWDIGWRSPPLGSCWPGILYYKRTDLPANGGSCRWALLAGARQVPD